MEYYYTYFNTPLGLLGITSSGSFTKNKSRWITFDLNEKERFEASGIRPYGATHIGTFQNTNNFVSSAI